MSIYDYDLWIFKERFKMKNRFKKYIVLDCSTEQTSNLQNDVVLSKTFEGYSAYANAKEYIGNLILKEKKADTSIWCQVDEEFYNEIYTAALVRGTKVIKFYKIIKLDFRLELPY